LFIETKGRSLEEMDEIFGGHSAIHDAQIMKEVQSKINQKQPHEIISGGKTDTTTSNAV
jgi:hypothetical protein